MYNTSEMLHIVGEQIAKEASIFIYLKIRATLTVFSDISCSSSHIYTKFRICSQGLAHQLSLIVTSYVIQSNWEVKESACSYEGKSNDPTNSFDDTVYIPY